MVAIILAVLALFVLQSMLPSTFRYLLSGPGVVSRLTTALGPRDEPPAQTALGGRAERALANLFEALPVFLTLALLSMLLGRDVAAVPGAQIFLVARVLYVPAYLSGIPGVRSVVWMAGAAGLILMVIAII